MVAATKAAPNQWWLTTEAYLSISIDLILSGSCRDSSNLPWYLPFVRRYNREAW